MKEPAFDAPDLKKCEFLCRCAENWSDFTQIVKSDD